MSPTAAHPAVTPVGFWDRLAIVVLGLAGCALSYDALQQMAVAIHIRGFLTYLFPLVIDGFIAYGVRALLVLSEAPLRARLYVWVLFGTATAASIWANSLHAVRLNQQTTHSGLRLGDTVVAILSTLAPLALAGAVHLYILITRHHPGAGHAPDQEKKVSGKRTADHEHAARAPSPDQTRPADRPDDTSDRGHGPTSQAGPESVDYSDATGRSHQRTADQTTETVPADHEAPATGHRTNPTPDQTATLDTTGADQQTGVGPQGIENGGQTRKTTGQEARRSHRPAKHDRADHASGPSLDPAGAVHERPRSADRSAENAPANRDAPDYTDQPADRPGDHNEDGPSGGPQGARTTGHGTSHAPRPKSADQNDEVPWEVKVEVARQAALEAGRMTRRVLRPHLRRNNISISNEGFRKLQAQLYADPALAHLPRTTRKP
ncbi:DUF2637 domain-containing protein [Streptomyces sp. NPDC088747]|uniref:DUF2637 domain-containing protein n=1 Tax=Streptomyces sp. NPDC088747 TaxID=3365886 RepID=UPI0038023DF6